ncbi:MAG TPA: RsmD family RNA methyltransferase, partial [Acidobacteriaceae bacterium]
ASRGAAQVWLAEKSEPALQAIRANLKTLGIEAEVEVDARGAAALLERLAKPAERNRRDATSVTSGIDIVFLDPPWEADAEYTRTLEFLGSERGRALLKDNALVIAEHSAKKSLAQRYGALHRTRELKQGDAALTFYSYSR